jgi:hypothetical protein
MVKLASLTGYTPGSAAFTMGKIKRKLKNKTAGISSDSPAAKSRQGRPRTANSTPSASTPKKRGATTAFETPSKRARKGAAGRQPTSSPSGDDDVDEDFGESKPNVKVKKEEPAFDQGSGFYNESLEEREDSGSGGGGESYGFLDGIETFGGAGGGRSAANGYRK